MIVDFEHWVVVGDSQLYLVVQRVVNPLVAVVVINCHLVLWGHHITRCNVFLRDENCKINVEGTESLGALDMYSDDISFELLRLLSSS